MIRTTLLKTVSIAAGAVCVAAALANPAQAATLGFDDLSPSSSGSPIPSGYGGFNWNGFNVINGTTNSFNNSAPSSQNSVVSSANVAFVNAGGFGEITRSSLFTFKSTYLTGVWANFGGNVLVEGFQGATSLFSQFVGMSNAGPTLHTFNWSGIDRLRFTSYGSQLAMDDFTFDAPNAATAVPTPAMLPGLIGLGGAFWRKRKTKTLATVSESV